MSKGSYHKLTYLNTYFRLNLFIIYLYFIHLINPIKNECNKNTPILKMAHVHYNIVKKKNIKMKHTKLIMK